MSKSALQLLARKNGGVIPFVSDALSGPIPANAVTLQGLYVDDTGAIYAADVAISAIDHHTNGLPFDANGRLCLALTPGPVNYHQGLKFYDGALAVVGDGTGSYYDQGMYYAPGGALLGSGLIPPLTPVLQSFYPLTQHPLEMMQGADIAAQVRPSAQAELSIANVTTDSLIISGGWQLAAVQAFAAANPSSTAFPARMANYGVDEPAISEQGLAVRSNDISYQGWAHDVTQGGSFGWRSATNITTSFNAADNRTAYGVGSIRGTAVNGIHGISGGDMFMNNTTVRYAELSFFPAGAQQYALFEIVTDANGVIAWVVVDMQARAVSSSGGSASNIAIKEHDSSGMSLSFTGAIGNQQDSTFRVFLLNGPDRVADINYLGDPNDGIDVYACNILRAITTAGNNPTGYGRANSSFAPIWDDAYTGGNVARASTVQAVLPIPSLGTAERTLYGEYEVVQTFADAPAGDLVILGGMLDSLQQNGLLVVWLQATNSFAVLAVLGGAIGIAANTIIPAAGVPGSGDVIKYAISLSGDTYNLRINSDTYSGDEVTVGIGAVAYTQLFLYSSILGAGVYTPSAIFSNFKTLSRVGDTLPELEAYDETSED